MDKVYLSSPTEIAFMDHEQKRTILIRKNGLPDAGEMSTVYLFPVLLHNVLKLEIYYGPSKI